MISTASKTLLVGVLSLALVVMGCSTAWIDRAQAILAVVAPIATNILTISALLQSKTVSPEDLNKIQAAVNETNTAFALVRTLLKDYNDANAATSQAKIDAALKSVQTSLGGLLSSLHIKDEATQGRITAIVALVLSSVSSVKSLLPQNQALPAVKAAAKKATAPEHIKLAYNAIVTSPSGNPDVDKACQAVVLR